MMKRCLFCLIFIFSVSCLAELLAREPKIVYIVPTFWGNIFDPKAGESVYYDLEPLNRLHYIAGECGYDLRVAKPSRNRLYDMSRNSPIDSDTFEYLILFDASRYCFSYDEREHELDYLLKFQKEKLILILWEPPTTLPQNYKPGTHRIFSKVYTWRDDLVDDRKYFKIYYPVLRPMIENPIPFDEKRKLCVMISSNKLPLLPYKPWLANELYNERRSLAKFFEKEHPSDFELFGLGWPKTYQTYKGIIKGGLDQKVEMLKFYKFGIAYENGKNIPGYITEKIFDCFNAGTVPVYLGASNIASYVPKNCFIHREDFHSNEELYEFLNNMPKKQYEEYIRNIQTFLTSDQAQLYSHDNFIKIMMQLITTPPVKFQESQSS